MPFYELFGWEGSPTTEKSWYPYSNLSTGGHSTAAERQHQFKSSFPACQTSKFCSKAIYFYPKGHLCLPTQLQLTRTGRGRLLWTPRRIRRVWPPVVGIGARQSGATETLKTPHRWGRFGKDTLFGYQKQSSTWTARFRDPQPFWVCYPFCQDLVGRHTRPR